MTGDQVWWALYRTGQMPPPPKTTVQVLLRGQWQWSWPHRIIVCPTGFSGTLGLPATRLMENSPQNKNILSVDFIPLQTKAKFQTFHLLSACRVCWRVCLCVLQLGGRKRGRGRGESRAASVTTLTVTVISLSKHPKNIPEPLLCISVMEQTDKAHHHRG